MTIRLEEHWKMQTIEKRAPSTKKRTQHYQETEINYIISFNALACFVYCCCCCCSGMADELFGASIFIIVSKANWFASVISKQYRYCRSIVDTWIYIWRNENWLHKMHQTARAYFIIVYWTPLRGDTIEANFKFSNSISSGWHDDVCSLLFENITHNRAYAIYTKLFAVFYAGMNGSIVKKIEGWRQLKLSYWKKHSVGSGRIIKKQATPPPPINKSRHDGCVRLGSVWFFLREVIKYICQRSIEFEWHLFEI